MEPSIQEGTLHAIVNRLVESIHPDKIILFGSRASGRAPLSSDFDLLIVGPSSDPHHRRLKPAYDALWGIRAPIDLLWYTPEEVDQVSSIPTHIATVASQTGRLIYKHTSE